MEINLKNLGNLPPQTAQLLQTPVKPLVDALAGMLHKGAQFTATVVEAKGGNQYLLEIFKPGTQGSVQVIAQSITALAAGNPLRLEVVENGAPLQVRIVRQQTGTEGTPVENALRQFLPKQQELSALVNQLTHFVQNESKSALPAEIQQLAKNLLASLPDKNTLANAEGLKQAVRDSGLFLESKLSQLAQADAQTGGKLIDPSLPNDLKAKLLVLAEALANRATPAPRPGQEGATTPLPLPLSSLNPQPAGPPLPAALANQLPPTTQAAAEPPLPGNPGATGGELSNSPLPGERIAMAKQTAVPVQGQDALPLPPNTEASLKELSGQAEGALAKLVLNQLSSLPQLDASQQTWRVDIPFTLAGQPESAKLEIEREIHREEGDGEHASSGQEEAAWSVTVELNPPGLGKLGGKITLLQGTVSAYFWSGDPAIAELVHDNLPLLQARLEAVGIKTGRLDAAMGVAPPSESERRQRMRLLDLHA